MAGSVPEKGASVPVAALFGIAAGALPTGAGWGRCRRRPVRGGSGRDCRQRHNLTINQASSHGIINWHSFSIGSANSVQFNNGAGATLNRVTGGNLSRIDGTLNATGSVYLINPQGVVIGPGGKVVTNGSFVASTRDIPNSQFMAGGSMTASGASNGDVVNAGTITSKTGDAILVGRSVTNKGTINAPKGQAALAAGNEIVLQTSGTGPYIAVSGGKGDVTNTGTVKAAQAALASAGGNVYALVQNNGGLVSATGTKTINGHVWLTAGGTAQVSGTVTAKNTDGSGGKVTVRGQEVSISGSIDASATAPAKNGGNVSVVAEDRTVFSGTIGANGGTGGQGGRVETSGAHLKVADGARVSTQAVGGMSGTWLIDPQDFTIAASGGDMTGATLSSNLSSGDVTIQSSGGATAGNGDIFVNDAVSWSSSHTLTLDAYHSIAIDAAMTVSGSGGVVLKTNDNTDGITDGDYSFGLTSTGFTGRIDFTGDPTTYTPSLSINGTGYTLIYTMSQLDGLDNYDAATGTGTETAVSGNYALATGLDASGTTYFDALISTGSSGTSATEFGGTFTGLGHAIDNLTIDKSGANAGLFGYSTGTIRDIGIAGGTITGSYFVGGLAGISDGGLVSDAYVTASVSSTLSGDTYAGGLVGSNTGTISNAYATGAVSGVGGDVGGLVGNKLGGTITNAYATGAVR